MGFRFRKSLKIAPGVRLNLSKSGVGMSAGIRGARVGLSSRGTTYSSVGIPGTGMSYMSHSKKGRLSQTQSTEPTTKDYIMAVKFLLWLLAIIIGLIFPPLGSIMIGSVVFYYYKRNKSPKYKAQKLYNKAKVLFQEGKYFEAEKLLRETKDLNPDIPKLNFLLGGALHNQKEYKKATSFLEISLKNNHLDDEVVLTLASCYFNQEKYDKVISLIQSFPGGWENNLKALQLLGVSFSNKKQHDLAIDVFKKAPLRKRNLDDELLELHYNLGIVYENAGDKKNSLKHFKKVYAYDIKFRDIQEKINVLEK